MQVRQITVKRAQSEPQTLDIVINSFAWANYAAPDLRDIAENDNPRQHAGGHFSI
jgi:hypothetical protein